jgi:hypothetical protein
VSRFEYISLLIGLLTAAIAAIASIRGTRFSKKQLDYQRSQASLAEIQSKQIRRELQVQSRAVISAEFERSGDSYRLVITNCGGSPATQLRIAGREGEPFPDTLLADDVRSIFPVPELPAGGSISLFAALHLRSELPALFIFTWNDERGSIQQAEVRALLDS